MARFLRYLFALLLFMTAAPTLAQAWVRVPLADGVSFELQDDWLVGDDGALISLDRFARELARKGAADLPRPASTLAFVAESHDSRGDRRAVVQVRYYPEAQLGQKDVRTWDANAVAKFDANLRDGISRAMKGVGGRLHTWAGTKAVDIDGLRVLLTEYRRGTGLEPGVFAVQLVRVFSGPRSFTLIVSYRESDGPALAQVAQRIVSSMRQTP